jgi:hypothetical protein
VRRTGQERLQVEIQWAGKGWLIAKTEDRSIRIGGEWYEGEPDFLIYARTVKSWDDGSPISESEKVELLDEVVDVAARQGWKLEISWKEFDLQAAIERYRRQEEERRRHEGGDLSEPPD